MNNEKKEDNNLGTEKNDLEKEDDIDFFKENDFFSQDEPISPVVKNVKDDVISTIVEEDRNIKILEESLENLDNEEKIAFDQKLKLINELELVQKEKIKELDNKVEEFKVRDKKLEETVYEYEQRNLSLIEMRKEYQQKLIEIDEKNDLLNQSKNEFEEKTGKLNEARQHFKDLSLSFEEKKLDIEKIELKMNRMEETLERNRRQFERKNLDFEKEKLKFEKGRKELQVSLRESEIDSYSNLSTVGESIITVEVDDKEKGKIELLQDILRELSSKGKFQSCFLIDGKGMIIAEYSNVKLDTMAIGAMFSLVCTSLLRTVNSLSLQALEYFKMSSSNGEFMLRNINISGYERNFILLVYYSEVDLILPKVDQKLGNRSIKKILRSVKRDFNEFGKGEKFSWIFDNLIDKINFLKQTFYLADAESDDLRLNFLSKASNTIKELFER